MGRMPSVLAAAASLRTVAQSLSSPAAVGLILLSAVALLDVTSSQRVFAREAVQTVTAANTATDKAAKSDDSDDDDEEDDEDGFQQPVRVGDLIGRDVIAPVESQNLLGSVVKVVGRQDDVTIVMTHGGVLGFGTHLVCVSADALALTGHALQAKDVSPKDLDDLPVCDGAGAASLAANATIKMNLAKPAH